MSRLVDKLPKHMFMVNPKSYRMAHPVYKLQDIINIEPTYRPPRDLKDRLAYWSVVGCRKFVDTATFYNPDTMKE